MIYTNLRTRIKYLDITQEGTEANLNQERLPVISLFSGSGGLDIGLEQAGYETVACVEIDDDCRETLKFNRPHWGIFESTTREEDGKIISRKPGDIRDIDADELLKFTGLNVGEAALVVGGAPCQPFSNIGKKQGQDDEKNGDLFKHFVRIVKGVQPEAFIFENVTGITQSKHSPVIDYMLDSFSGSGYSLTYGILNAANYGVPQRRERFFLIGIRGGETAAFPLPTHSKDTKSWETFINDLDMMATYIPHKWKSVRDAFTEIPAGYKARPDYVVMNISDVVLHRMTHIKQGQNFKVLPMELRPDCWKSGRHQGNDTFGRLIADLPSITIRTAAYNPAKGMYIHPFEDRGLNSVEMAALQDFPYEWRFRIKAKENVTLVSGGKQIGNAVPPGLAKALGLAIRQQIRTNAGSTETHLVLAEES